MNPDTRKSVCIMGSGVAGLATAVFLDAQGYRVTLIEKKSLLGGRTYGFKDRITGSDVDNGQHIMMGAYHETLRFLDMIGSRGKILVPAKNTVPLFNANGLKDVFTLPNWRPPLNALWAFLKFKSFSWSDIFGLFKIRAALKKHNPKKINKLTIIQWLQNMGQSPKAIREFWSPFTLATLNDTVETACAHHLLTILQKAFLGSRRDGQFLLPKSSLQNLIGQPALNYLNARGHRVVTGVAALKLHILDNIVRELECSNGEKIKADYFVSALPPPALLRTIPKGFAETLSYFIDISKIKFSPIISVNLWFDQDFIDDYFVGATNTRTHWFFNRNRIAGIQGPPYHYVGVISAAQDLLEASGEEIKMKALMDLAEIYPASLKAKLIHSLVNKERVATILHAPETEAYRPMQQTPFENFYVTGDWTQTYLPATIESAAVSAAQACTHILNSL